MIVLGLAIGMLLWLVTLGANWLFGADELAALPGAPPPAFTTLNYDGDHGLVQAYPSSLGPLSSRSYYHHLASLSSWLDQAHSLLDLLEQRCHDSSSASSQFSSFEACFDANSDPDHPSNATDLGRLHWHLWQVLQASEFQARSVWLSEGGRSPPNAPGSGPVQPPVPGLHMVQGPGSADTYGSHAPTHPYLYSPTPWPPSAKAFRSSFGTALSFLDSAVTFTMLFILFRSVAFIISWTFFQDQAPTALLRTRFTRSKSRKRRVNRSQLAQRFNQAFTKILLGAAPYTLTHGVGSVALTIFIFSILPSTKSILGFFFWLSLRTCSYSWIMLFCCWSGYRQRPISSTIDLGSSLVVSADRLIYFRRHFQG